MFIYTVEFFMDPQWQLKTQQSLYQFIKNPNELKMGSDYSIFKKGIRPMWEDEMNAMGGRWILRLDPNIFDDQLNEIWLDLLLHLIGEYFPYCEEICGVVINVRQREYKLSVWTRNIYKEQAVLSIGQQIRYCLRLENDVKLYYESHEVAEKKQSRDNFIFQM